MTQTIRQATKADIPVIADHIKSLAAHHGDDYVADLDFLIHSFDLENSGITTFLGETETTPISFAMTHPWARFHENACALKRTIPITMFLKNPISYPIILFL